MHRVVKAFTDLQDNDHVYRAGDLFPRAGVDVSAERVAELASTNNKRGEVLIIAEDAEIRAVTGEKPKAKQDIKKPKKGGKKTKTKEK